MPADTSSDFGVFSWPSTSTTPPPLLAPAAEGLHSNLACTAPLHDTSTQRSPGTVHEPAFFTLHSPFKPVVPFTAVAVGPSRPPPAPPHTSPYLASSSGSVAPLMSTGPLQYCLLTSLSCSPQDSPRYPDSQVHSPTAEEQTPWPHTMEPCLGHSVGGTEEEGMARKVRETKKGGCKCMKARVL